jgi:2-dehydro-3-deoxyphosphooctonate aldolase (KDO 8-P synthase)
MHVLDIIQQRLNQQFFLVAGPCAVESKDLCFEVAEKVSKLTAEREIPYVFKASFKKVIVVKMIALPVSVMSMDLLF